MDLFRRIFGKTSEESSEEQPNVGAQPAPDAKQPAAETAESQESAVTEEPVQSKSSGDTEDLDAATLPVRMPNAPKPKKPIPDGVTQPLSPEVLIANTNSTLSFGQASDVGLVRNNNQDAVLSLFFTSESVDDHPNFGLFIVADGMGGHHDGEKAAAIAIRTVATHMNKQIYMPLLTTNGKADLPPISDMLREAVQKSNKEVIANVPDGGTTVTAVAVVGDLAYIAHVGDSRAYLITADGIEQITRDHSLVQRLIELDQLTQEEADIHPNKNVLYRALGQNEDLEVDTRTRRLPSNSRLLICSDGLWGQIDERDLYEIAMNTADPQQACDKLVALANTHGGVDNITVILLKIT